MPPSPPLHDRTHQSLRAQYEIEKALADQLRNAPKDLRPSLYASVYNDLFKTVPDHPTLHRSATTARLRALRAQLRLLDSYLTPNATFLEVGAGDSSLTYSVAARVKYAFALDVCSELISPSPQPDNYSFLHYDGIKIQLPDSSIDLAFSWQVIEHLHPDDALCQLQDIYRLLKPGGIYICATSNKLSGPWDVSYHFTTEATGLHLKEYTIGQLAQLFKQAGFDKVWVQRPLKKWTLRLPVWPLALLENIFALIPHRFRVPIARTRLIAYALDTTIAGVRE